MRAVVQRVRRAAVSVENKPVAEIEQGYVILLGIGPQDTTEKAIALAQKIARLRVFEDDQGKMNLSLLDTRGMALVISQFTLYADTRRGNRPSFTDAAGPDLAAALVDSFANQMVSQGVPVKQGIFGAHMLVEIENDGPVTIWFDND